MVERGLRDHGRPGLPPVVFGDVVDRLRAEVPGPTRIRCPRCAWQPAPADWWYCATQAAPEHHRGCGTSWNTFATRGRCPGCDHQWRWTACLVCQGWSKHDDWYVLDDDPPAG
ncbi:MAG TPA: hypothetical protein VMM93_13305 [Vicinamibacterales bacterium]|nr:hypothetical protein [Vicinamibacterales bacterium]